MTTYVYGIAGADLPRLPEGLAGVGDPPRTVRVLREEGAAAVVSDCPDGLRPKRRDLFAHQRVLTAAAAAGPVLPMRFGSTAAGEDEVRATLARHAPHYREQLRLVGDRVEYNVKTTHHEEMVLRAVLAHDPEAARLNAVTRSRGGGAHQERLRLGEILARAVQARAEQDERAVAETLAPHAEHCQRGPLGDGLVTNLSFLVDRDATAGFLTAVEELKAAGPHLDLRVHGPLPPYSFVRAEAARAA